MKRLDGISMTLAIVLALLLGHSPAWGQEELPGANYFGDAGACDGIIDPLDATQLKSQLASSSGSYAGCKPASWQVQDLDGDQSVSPLDYSRLQGWVNLSWPSGITYSGAPWAVIDADTAIDMQAADTVSLEAMVYRRNVSGNEAQVPGAGWGVVFEVVGGCMNARIEGLDPTPFSFGGKDQMVTEPSAFAYTGAWNGSTASPARVVLHRMGCIGVIQVQARVPADAEFDVAGERFGSQITGAVVEVNAGFGETLWVTPETASIGDGETVAFAATHSVIGDVTSLATWGVSGGCTLLGPGLVQAPEACADY